MRCTALSLSARGRDMEGMGQEACTCGRACVHVAVAAAPAYSLGMRRHASLVNREESKRDSTDPLR